MALTRITQGVIKPNENYVVNNINSSGVTTSTNFKTGTSNLHNVGIEIAGINVLGADTPIGLGATIYNSGAAIFSGDVKVGGALTVGGVLSYEDVTNIDSVGVITARGGLKVTGGTSYFAGLVGIGTDAGYGDAKLTVEGTAALTNNDTTLQIKDSVNDAAAGRGGNIGFSAYVNGTQRTFAAIGGLKSAAGTGNFNGDLALYTRVNGQTNLSERLRIDSAGLVGIGTDNPAYGLDIWGTGSQVRIVDTDPYAANVHTIFNQSGGQLTMINRNGNGYGTFVINQQNSSGQVERFRITNTGKVGIGEDTPLGILHVKEGDSGVTNPDNSQDTVFIENSANAGITIATPAANTGYLTFADPDDSNVGQIIYRHSDNSMSMFVNAAERLRIDSDGRVGINTTSPQNSAKVQYYTSTARHQSFQSSDGDLAIVSDNNSNPVAYIKGTGSADLLNVFDNTTEVFTIKDGGKVGINQSNPGDLLEIHPISNNDGITIKDTGAVYPALTFDINRTGADQFLGNIRGMWNGTTVANILLETGSDTTNKDDGVITFRTASAGSPAERLRIASDGKIGINVTSPSTNLQIGGATVDSDNVITLGKRVSSSESNLPKIGHHSANGSSSSLALCATSSSGRIHFFTGNGGAGFGASSNAERMVITSGGNIGIGTDNPSEKLSIENGNIFIRDTSDNESYIYFTHSSTANRRSYIGAVEGTGNSNSLVFATNGDGLAGVERLRITSAGNIGIGTISPESARLHVYNATADAHLTVETPASGKDARLNLYAHNTGVSQIRLGDDTDTNIGRITYYHAASGTNEANSLEIITGDYGRVRVASSGLVLPQTTNKIRTDSSDGSDNKRIILAAGGDNSQSRGSQIAMYGNEYSSHEGRLQLLAGNSGNTNGVIQMYTGGEEKVRITSAGLVGINTTVPDKHLHVYHPTTNYISKFESGDSTVQVGFFDGDTSNGNYVGAEGENLTFYTNGFNERMRINSNGTVNIGGANEVQLDASNDEILYLHGAVVGANVDFGYGMRIDLDDDNTGTTSADRERGCGIFQFNGNCYGGDTSNETRIWNIFSDVNCNADYDNVYGVYSDCKSNHDTGTVGHMRGLYAITQHANTGAVGEMIGVYGISQLTTGSSSLTVNDVIGGKFRANMCAGSSTANATDVVAVWGNIDNDNETAQATGGKCALFYGQYDKTTGLHNPQGIRLDTDVPNYFRGDIAIDGGGNFLPTGNHKIHIRNGTNATGILLEQTGNQYSVISGDSNRSSAENAILDIRGYWSGTQVAKIRFETGTDTTNKDDGEIQFCTAASGTITDRMHIQPNGEIAMKSNGTPTDALANLHVQNGTFRVSQASNPTTAYTQITSHTSGQDGNRHRIATWNTADKCTFAVDHNGTVMAHASHYAGRTRGDANNAQPEMYRHGAHHFTAYSSRTDISTAYRSRVMVRAWDAGDNGDRNVIYYVNSDSDTETASETADQKFGIKADGRAQFGQSIYAGRVESDAGSPTSVYGGATGTSIIAYPGGSGQWSRLDARTTDNTDRVFGADTGGGLVFKVESSGRVEADGSFISPANDYAEYFEWTDGNTSNADRRGITVVMDGEKIRPATNSDDKSKIIGVVSAQPSVIGDSAWSEWKLAHLKDAYGSFVTKDEEFLVWNRFGTFIDTDGVEKPNPQPNINDYNRDADHQVLVSDIEAEKAKGNIPQAAIDQNLRVTKSSRIYNPDYDPTRDYVPRSYRPEWDPIGLLGKLVVRRGQPIGANWILMKSNVGTDPNNNTIILDKYFVR